MEHAKQNLPERNELRLYIPKPEDGWFYMQMLSDPATMSYNAPGSRRTAAFLSRRRIGPAGTKSGSGRSRSASTPICSA